MSKYALGCVACPISCRVPLTGLSRQVPKFKAQSCLSWRSGAVRNILETWGPTVTTWVLKEGISNHAASLDGPASIVLVWAPHGKLAGIFLTFESQATVMTSCPVQGLVHQIPWCPVPSGRRIASVLRSPVSYHLPRLQLLNLLRPGFRSQDLLVLYWAGPL